MTTEILRNTRNIALSCRPMARSRFISTFPSTSSLCRRNINLHRGENASFLSTTSSPQFFCSRSLVTLQPIESKGPIFVTQLRSFSTSRVSSDGSDSDFQPSSKVPGSSSDNAGNANAVDEAAEIQQFLKEAVSSHDVLLFMKGSPNAPKCGFSAKVVGMLKGHGVDFSSADVLGSPEIRQGVKEFSNWPTFPQLYVNGEFIGGCDIVTDLESSGELKKILEPIVAKQKSEKESKKSE